MMSLHAFLNLNILQLPHDHTNSTKPALFNLIPVNVSSSSVKIRNIAHQQPQRPPPANQSVAAIVFGDGWPSPSRLYPLTKRRSEGAIPIAGNYRLIDAVVSNCINSNISKIYAITQFNSTSLNSHLSRAYSGASSLMGLGRDGFVEVIAACQTPEEKGWFQGTADAIRRCLWVVEDQYPVLEYFLILPGHHLYKMNYQKLIEAHRSSSADITLPVLGGGGMRDHDNNPGFGFFKLNNSTNRVTEFQEEPAAMKTVAFNDIISRVRAGMGIYVINRDVMIKLLNECFPTANDLTSEIIAGAISLGMKVDAYEFDGYWEDMRSIEAFYHANMESTKKRNITTNTTTEAAHNFYLYDDRDSPLYTLPRHLPPTLITDAVIIDSLVGDGCVLSRCNIRGTVVGMRTRVGDGATVEDSIIMGSDAYPSISSDYIVNNIPNIGIGEGSLVRKAIVDKNARIGKNVMIINKDGVEEGNKEGDGYVITGGIVVIIRSAVIRDGSIL